mgnify:FL=1|tara:strand:+ start:4600 stop:6588 length:1989 start_codon:yes stop_codon:yes gene_type:complete
MKLASKKVVYFFLSFLFFLIVFFYIFSRGINVSVLPTEIEGDAKINIEKGVGFSFGKRLIFFPGKKTISVTAPGYYKKEITFELSKTSNVITLELQKLPGKAIFELVPKVNAKVLVDSIEINLEEDKVIELTAGPHLLAVKHPLYLDYERSIEVEGLGKEQTFSIKLVPGWGNLSFSTNPEKAEVFVNSVLIGNTPIKAKISAGNLEIVYKYAGYLDLKVFRKIEVGEELILPTANLELLPGTLDIDVNPTESSILLDEEFIGLSPKEIKVSPKKAHKISVLKEGYRTQSLEVKVQTQETKQLKIILEPVFGKVEISSSPRASIFLDGNYLSDTPFQGELQVLKQKIELTKKGYRSHVEELNPKESIPSRISVTLITEEQARLKESPKSYVSSTGVSFRLLEPSFILMGAKRGEEGQRANEVIREVDLTKPFYLGIYEITNSNFMKFKAKNSKGEQLISNEEPITNITWNDAALYCNWLSSKEGLQKYYQQIGNKIVGFNLPANGYRLPTEAEWAWTARFSDKKGIKQIKFPWGNNKTVKQGSGNFADESSKGSVDQFIPNYKDGYSRLAPVGNFNPNEKGIYDLGGNVSEWTNDFYAITYLNQRLETDPIGPLNGRSHVVRGSSWKTSSLSKLRYSYRDSLIDSNEETGFRVARWLIGKDE